MQLLRKRNTKKARKVCKIARGERRGLAMMCWRCTVQRWKETTMKHKPRATWRSYDPDLWKVDLDGKRPLKPHEREALDIGALAFDMVLAGMKAARETSPRAHVIAWLRTPAGMAYEKTKLEAARAACKAMAAQMLRDMRRAA